ncbi:hypothetical protein [Tunturiibacter gelidoferens]|uniref:Uncharacterized protein n=1 Tax=Tunturiibacter gelidiferens TaxID=3069689 RepID=A0A9X0QK81_9BACT|nr:hypothetical protein [Edaphobacter lichenicola]MBB5331785.1 hypothetical protein [Edaphobacter lichenicola]
MSDPNHAELINQIHLSECEIEALRAKIANTDESSVNPADFSVMRNEQEEHRQRILKCKSEIDQNKYAG